MALYLNGKLSFKVRVEPALKVSHLCFLYQLEYNIKLHPIYHEYSVCSREMVPFQDSFLVNRSSNKN